MATIFQSEVIKRAIDDLKLAPAREKIPSEIADKVLLTYDLKKKYSDLIFTGTSSASGNVSVMAADNDYETYITAAHFSFAKDVTCDVASGRIGLNIIVNGANKDLCSLPVITLTAQTGTCVISMPYPLKIDRNTAITTNLSFAAGVLTRATQVTVIKVPAK